jgi:hypothetical protein
LLAAFERSPVWIGHASDPHRRLGGCGRGNGLPGDRVAGGWVPTRWLYTWRQLLAVPATGLMLVNVLYPATMAVYATNAPPITLGPLLPRTMVGF